MRSVFRWIVIRSSGLRSSSIQRCSTRGAATADITQLRDLLHGEESVTYDFAPVTWPYLLLEGRAMYCDQDSL